MKGQIHIGTSGWHYPHWKGPFYPRQLASKDFLEFYRGHFTTVELNNSFYRLPEEATFTLWREAVPAGFIFAVKASRYLTHLKKLKDTGAGLATFLKRVEVLKDRLGPILFQLPPSWHFNPERLEHFLASLPGEHRYAFEFRDSSWFTPRTYDSLARHQASFCIYELAGKTSPREVTSDLIYIRLHGPGAAYCGQYSEQALTQWATEIRNWTSQGKEIYCYFDNDEAGYAAKDALRLKSLAEN